MATTIDQLALMTATVVDGDLLVLRDVSVTGNNKDVKLTIGKLKLDVINAVTLTGDQTVAGVKAWVNIARFNSGLVAGTDAASFGVNINGPDTQGRTLGFQTASVLRWAIQADATPETGGNVGTDLRILAHNDNGSVLSTPIFIKRSTGYVGLGTNSPGVNLSVYGASGTVASVIGRRIDLTLLYAGFPTQTRSILEIARGGAQVGGMVISGAQLGTDGAIGGIFFANESAGIEGTDELRVAQVQVSTSGAVNSGRFSIMTANAGVLSERVRVMPNGNVGIGTTAPACTLHIVQSSTTATIPVLILDQADLSEDFIQFTTTVGAGNPVDTAALGTYYGKARVSVNGTMKFIALYNS